MAEDIWEHILINGKATQLKIKNPQYKNGKLISIEDLRPFSKRDGDGNPLTPTVTDALNEKRRIYGEFFKKSFKNLLILSGAGSSMDVGGLSMYQLWKETEKKYKVEKTESTPEINGLELIQKFVKYNSEEKNLEALLSQIDGYSKFIENDKITIGEEERKLSDLKMEIFSLIKEKCTIDAPKEKFPHKIFLEKLLQRKLTSPRVKIFTVNYDMLFEYAATEVNAIVVDGFSYTFPRTFSGRYFDYDLVQREGSKLKEEDNFVQRVFHLHKLHGSLNWERDDESQTVRIAINPKKPLMVYPREAKYEDSYGQPFFEMMARFQRNLRKSDDTLLISIGYSFNDKHINAAIEEALNQNPGFRLAIVNPGFDSEKNSASLKEIKKAAKESERILMVSETFSDFANHYPEIQTYDSYNHQLINLNNAKSKD